MTELLTGAGMRAHESAAIESGDVTGLELMERAGQSVVEAMEETWPELLSKKGIAAVLCGPGNNGGDGFVIARLLQGRGWAVRVYAFGDTDALPPDAQANCDRWRQTETVAPFEDAGFSSENAPDVIIDALFGIGLTRPLTAPLDLVVSGVNALRAGGATRIVAVDIPSGVCADSGRALGVCVQADLTVTFHCLKPGHVLRPDGDAHSRHMVVKDIGLPASPQQAADGEVIRTIETPPADLLAKKGAAHKYGHGHAVIVSGPAARTGAARLAARGALRIGAGLVTVAAHADALAELGAHLTAIMLRQANDGHAFRDGFAQDPRVTALCAGPALGLSWEAADLLRAVLALNRATVLDADALTLLADDPALFDALHKDCVLTPHAGEFARVFPDISEKLSAPARHGPAFSKIDATRLAAARAGCVVLLKGPDTVIAAPDGQCVVNPPDEEAGWLATAGSGDVLAGFICGLLTRRFPPLQAAAAATRLHTDCARRFGPGLIAEDLPDVLPQVFRALGV
ncbi:MAG: NAD(P)H-hydrate dehydratase [Pseudomonadota bacterium]